MNFDDLDFEWSIAPHDAIEGYFEQFTGEVVDCGINEITIKVQGELFTLKKNKDFNQNANISIVREMSPDEILDVEKVDNFIGKDDPISKLRDLADNTKQ